MGISSRLVSPAWCFQAADFQAADFQAPDFLKGRAGRVDESL